MFTIMLTFSSSRGRKIQTYILRAPSDEEFLQFFLSQNDFQELLLKQGIPTSESWVRVRRKCTKKNISLEMELECIDSTSKMIGTALLNTDAWWLGEWVRTFFPISLICMDKNYIQPSILQLSFIKLSFGVRCKETTMSQKV